MKRFGLMGIMIVGAAMALFYFGGASHAVDRYEAEAQIKCLNQSIAGEAVLVTTHGQPLQIQCDVRLKNPVPEGYLPTPVDYQWSAPNGSLSGQGNHAQWTDPEPGVQTVSVKGVLKYLPPNTGFFSRPAAIEAPFEAKLTLIVPQYVEEIVNGKIDRFHIGDYPDPTNPVDLAQAEVPSRIKAHPETYSPPKIFYQVNPQNFFITIFKNYTLGEFDLDPRFIPVEYPRYVAIHPKILKKLDLLQDLMGKQGVAISKFKFIYGFRCPDYNTGAQHRDGGETLKANFSNHMYGQAVDMIVDEDNDLVLDDLNKDGKVTVQDAITLRNYVDELDRRLLDQGSDLIGGAGFYYHHDYYERGEVVQSPYVHMDVRGFTREDGTFIRWGEDTDKIGVKKMKDPYAPKKPVPPYPWEKK